MRYAGLSDPMEFFFTPDEMYRHAGIAARGQLLPRGVPPRKGLGAYTVMGPVPTDVVPTFTKGIPPSQAAIWEYAAVNTRAAPGTTDPYANPPTPAVYAPLPLQSGHFAIDFPWQIQQPHWSRQTLWWTGQTVLNAGAPQYSNDCIEYLRSALVDSDFSRVKNFIMWYYAINNPNPHLYWDAASLSWGSHFLVTQPGADAINYLNLCDYKYILTEAGPVYLPLSYQDLGSIWSTFIQYMYQMSASDMYQMQHLWAVGAIPDPTEYPIADRLTPTHAPHSPYGPCMVPEMYRRGSTALAAAAPYIEIIAAILAIVTAGLALAAFLAAGTGAGAAAAGAVATDVGAETAGDVAVDTGADVAIDTSADVGAGAALDAAPSLALTTSSGLADSSIEEVIVTGSAPISAGTLATTATAASVVALGASGMSSMTAQNGTQASQQTQQQPQQQQKSTLQQIVSGANQVKSVVGAGMTIAQALSKGGASAPLTTSGGAAGGTLVTAQPIINASVLAGNEGLYILLGAAALLLLASS
jgi:hypothetical protein